ncbi:unnamed protein product, partial [Musa textilis]
MWSQGVDLERLVCRYIAPLCRPRGVEVSASRVWRVGHVVPLCCPRGVVVLTSRGRHVSHMASLC